MKRLSCGVFLLFAASLMAQRQGYPPYGTQPTFPQEHRPMQPMLPDTRAPLPETLNSVEVQQQIQNKLTTEPLLVQANVKVQVDDAAVVLSGTVDDERQHCLALQIAQSYAGNRSIVDNIRIGQRT
jgi:osmotically-inducible protein OsmY